MGEIQETTTSRSLIARVRGETDTKVLLRGWIVRLRSLAKNTFIVLRDCTGEVQCVANSALLSGLTLKLEDSIEIYGVVKAEARASQGYEIHIERLSVLNPAGNQLPFHSTSDASRISSEVLIEFRPLALRTESYADTFRIQGAILAFYREYLRRNHFSEIITSKIVSSGVEGGTNLFEIKYFERSAYLAQSPQFYKEECVAGFERVFETGHVYRAEPHASSRHLTEYYSLDLEMGFIDGPEEIIEFERGLLSAMFEHLTKEYGQILKKYRKAPLVSLEKAPVWEFEKCVALLKQHFGRSDLHDDLDAEAERQLCSLAEKETGVAAVFVLGFPLSARPFYTCPRGTSGAAQSFDLLFEGLEITTGGQRLHTRLSLEAALRARKIDPASFESHLKMFELGMPPHGGLAIGLERLTAQILGKSSVKETTLYPRDRYRLTP